jgi:hypothetical protein
LELLGSIGLTLLWSDGLTLGFYNLKSITYRAGEIMTLLEFKQKYLGLIEELNPNSEYLTDDPDLAAKQNAVVNQVMFEMARIKKIPKYVEITVNTGDALTFEDIEKAVGYEIYQLGTIGGVKYVPKANGTVLKILESGVAEIDCYVYPERITEKTKDKAYEFELSPDVLEIMPYGVAADLLKSDVSAEYGNIYMARYEAMKRELDPRYQMATIYIDGGYDI